MPDAAVAHAAEALFGLQAVLCRAHQLQGTSHHHPGSSTQLRHLQPSPGCTRGASTQLSSQHSGAAGGQPTNLIRLDSISHATLCIMLVVMTRSKEFKTSILMLIHSHTLLPKPALATVTVVICASTALSTLELVCSAQHRLQPEQRFSSMRHSSSNNCDIFKSQLQQ